MVGVVTVRGRWAPVRRRTPRPPMPDRDRARVGAAHGQLDHLRLGGGQRPGDRDRARLLPGAARHDGARRVRPGRDASPRSKRVSIAFALRRRSSSSPSRTGGCRGSPCSSPASWSWYGLTKRRVPLDPIESLTGELVVLADPGARARRRSAGSDRRHPVAGERRDWGFLLGTGAITAIPLLLFAFAAQRVPFTLLGPANYLVPLINFLLGWLRSTKSLPPIASVRFRAGVVRARHWSPSTPSRADEPRAERHPFRSADRHDRAPWDQRVATSVPSKKRSSTSTAAV